MTARVQVYALHDSDPVNHPMVRINPTEATDYNAKGYGIFWTVNEFHGPRRIANLVRINAWAVDIDKGEKAAMIERIEAGLVPSLVVETKAGFHVYFKAKDANPEHWRAIVLDRLVPFYGADPNARDLARILRMPGYFHLKNPKEPFLVQKVWEWDVAYTELQMAYFYPDQNQRKHDQDAHNEARREVPEKGTFWDRVWHLDHAEALRRLSGHPAVGSEVYSFRTNASGTKNIYVNDKSTSAWVDRDGRIGSLSRGGPTLIQWLKWFGHSTQRAVEITKEIFPELRS